MGVSMSKNGYESGRAKTCHLERKRMLKPYAVTAQVQITVLQGDVFTRIFNIKWQGLMDSNMVFIHQLSQFDQAT
jgi:hypothetical protein